MATLTVDVLDRVAGLAEPTAAAAAGGGDDFPNDGRTFLIVRNGGGGAITVTCDSVVNCSQGFDHNEPDAVSVGAAGETWFGPFPTARFGASVAVSYSGVSSVTVAAVRMPSS